MTGQQPGAADPTAEPPEVWHFIWLDGGMHGHAILTATAQDGRIHREDGRDPWEPLHNDDGLPCWYRVSAEIADQWTADDEDDDPATGGDHATVSGQVLRDQTAGDLGIAGGPPDAYRSGPGQQDDLPPEVLADFREGADPAIRIAQADVDAEAPGWRTTRCLIAEIHRLRARLADQQDAPEPRYQRIADAIRDTLDGADLQIVVWQAGQNTPVTDGVARLARVLDKAGLIDWAAFGDTETET